MFPERLSQYIALKARRDIRDPAWRDDWNAFVGSVPYSEMERLALEAEFGPGTCDVREAEGWLDPRV